MSKSSPHKTQIAFKNKIKKILMVILNLITYMIDKVPIKSLKDKAAKTKRSFSSKSTYEKQSDILVIIGYLKMIYLSSIS